MDVTYPPRTFDDWLAWGRPFVQTLAGSPEKYHVEVALIDAAGAAYDAYRSTWDAATDPNTRTKPIVEARRASLESLREAVRPIVTQLKGDPRVSVELLSELGVRRRDPKPTPAPIPAAAPAVTAFVTGEQSLRVEVRDPLNLGRRGKPAGMGAVELRFMRGPEPVGNPSAWPEMEIVGKTTHDQIYPDLGGDATVWVSCAWRNTANVRGPFSKPVSVRLAGNGTATAGGEGTGGMKIAA